MPQLRGAHPRSRCVPAYEGGSRCSWRSEGRGQAPGQQHTWPWTNGRVGPYGPGPLGSQPAFGLRKNFSQRLSLIGEMRNAETRGNSQRKPNNNNVLIKNSQGPLVPEPYPVSSYRHQNPHQVERLSTWWPDCSHDISCHSSENRHQEMEKKNQILEQEINCT